METVFLTGGAAWYADATPLGSLAVPTAYRPSSALNVQVSSLSAWTETALRQLCLDLWNANNQRRADVMCFCTGDYQLQTDAWFDTATVSSTVAAIRSFKYEGGKPDFEMGLKSYSTNFGTVHFNPTGQLNATRNAPVVSGGAALTGNTTNTSTTVVVSSAAGLQPYQLIAGTGIPAGAYIVSITDSTHIVISAAATATGSNVSLTLGDYDHALWLSMDHFQKKLNGGILNHDLSPDGSGMQGYIEAFYANFCGLPGIQARVYTQNS
jgi:hypothetical protein